MKKHYKSFLSTVLKNIQVSIRRVPTQQLVLAVFVLIQIRVLKPIARITHHPALASKMVKAPANVIIATTYHQFGEVNTPTRVRRENNAAIDKV